MSVLDDLAGQAGAGSRTGSDAARPITVLLAHAHPDDETIATGALIVELAARGFRVALVTASRGERGEVVAGPLSALAGTEELAHERERELQRATAILGVDERFWLGKAPARAAGRGDRVYRDSGMSWIRPGLAGPVPDIDDDAFAIAPITEVVADLEALIAHVRPALVISYDDGGGYGHPDHVRMHEASLLASQELGVPFAEVVQTKPDVEARHTTTLDWFDLPEHLPTVTAALRHHASQLTVDGTDIVHSGGQREPITTSLGLRLH